MSINPHEGNQLNNLWNAHALQYHPDLRLSKGAGRGEHFLCTDTERSDIYSHASLNKQATEQCAKYDS